MPASAMKACFLIAERRTIFCKDTLNICNFQIFRAVFYIEEWKVFLLLPSPPFTTLHLVIFPLFLPTGNTKPNIIFFFKIPQQKWAQSHRVK